MRLLIDISGFCYRAAHKLKLSTKGRSTNIVYGVLRSLEALLADLKPEEAIICWDAGKEARLALYPEYKANRKRDEDFKEDFARQVGLLQNLLTTLPVTQVREPGVEADDLIAALCGFMQHERVVIISGDHDLYQLVKKPLHTMLDFGGKTVAPDLKPSQILAYKVLVGDVSDNIKGVLGLGDVGARKLLKKHKTLKQIMRAAKAGKVKLGRMSYKEALPIVRRNLKLMKLPGTPMLTEAQRVSIISQYRDGRLHRVIREQALREQLGVLGFKSTLRRLSAFLIPFRPIERVKKGTHAKAEEAPKSPHRAESEAPQKRRARIIRKVKRPIRARIIRKVMGREDQDNVRAHDRRKAKPTKRDPSDGNEGASRALLAGVRKARASRARRSAAALSDSAEVRERPEQARREIALSVLSTLNSKRRWLAALATKRLKRFLAIVQRFEADPEYLPTAQEGHFLAELAEEYGMELPEWMKTEEEAKADKARKRRNRKRNRQEILI